MTMIGTRSPMINWLRCPNQKLTKIYLLIRVRLEMQAIMCLHECHSQPSETDMKILCRRHPRQGGLLNNIRASISVFIVNISVALVILKSAFVIRVACFTLNKENTIL